MAFCASCGHRNSEEAKFCEDCGSLLATSARSTEQRKTVTVLFCDLTGSTALGESLDPERLRAVLAGYFERMKAIVERHGGSVEKFIGDAVMAVFGVPVLHEDDALRAVRSAVEMRDALPELGLQGRIGVMTGEVVTGTEERLATGDAVNVAARLEQAAQPGEVLIGAPTFALVRDTADVEPVEPLALKGKADAVPAYRLLGVRDAPERRHDAPFVGREGELAIVREVWERVRSEQRCELVTVVGDGGVGKTRLAAELLESVDATVVRGRCLPYGEGITYWPVVEVLKQLQVLPTGEAEAAAIRALFGETDSATSGEEIAWAFRKTLEQVAAERPLVVIFDDIHWGEQIFLDLVEHVALLSSGASILLLCIGRPQLLDSRSSWPVTLRLEPLGVEDVDALIPRRVPPELRERITRAAGGNPLFVGEMLAMADETQGDVVVPPNLEALLAARLDQLDTEERSVLERGAVEGEIFHRGAIQALSPGEGQVTPRLASLVRKQLIRPDKTQLTGDDGFRFRHLLIRDAAYDALPKATRAALHERFAAWLEVHGTALVELDEILGYHREQACLYGAELGNPHDDGLAAAARRSLGAAGRRAYLRLDYAGAVRLFERAAALVRADEIDLEIEIDLVDALFWGSDGDGALRRARGYAERATTAGDAVAELCGRVQAALIATHREPEGATDRLAALVAEAIPLFETAHSDLGLYAAYRALGQVANIRGQPDQLLDAYDRAAAHARRAGLPYQLVGWRSMARFYGTTPVPDFLAWLDEQDVGELRNHWLRGRRAIALAMLGRFDKARGILADLDRDAADLGGSKGLAAAKAEAALQVELLAGNPAAAVEIGREGCRLLEELGDLAALSTFAGRFALALCALDRLDEADSWALRGADLGASDDLATQVFWRQARAYVLARRGEHSDAERLAREGVALSEESGVPDGQAGAYAALGDVLALAGNAEEAERALEEARARYERKGNLVMAERTRNRLTELRAP